MHIKILTSHRKLDNVTRFNEGLLEVVTEEFNKMSKKKQDEVLNGRSVSDYLLNEYQIAKNSIYALYKIYNKGGLPNVPRGLSKKEFSSWLKEHNEHPGELTIHDRDMVLPIAAYIVDFNKVNEDIVKVEV